MVKRAVLLAADCLTEAETVNIIENRGKSFVIERYDPISEEWVTQTVNALRIQPLPGQTWDDLED